MTTINPIQTTIQLGPQSQAAREVVTSLQQAGLFRAVVLSQQGQKVLLDTAFGRLSGTVSQSLRAGDEIQARKTIEHLFRIDREDDWWAVPASHLQGRPGPDDPGGAG